MDEAYFEFHGESLLEHAAGVPNLFVARTFSKAYGMAGFRVGMLAGSSAQMQNLRRSCSPYNVNGVALACLPAALADQQYVNICQRRCKKAADRFRQEFEALGIPFWPSRQILCWPNRASPCRICPQHEQRGILVRDRSSDWGCEGCVRITAGWRAHTDRF